MGEIIIVINNNNYFDVTCKLIDDIDKVHGKSKVEEADKKVTSVSIERSDKKDEKPEV